MRHSLEVENREFIRVKASLPVEYKFLGRKKDHPDLGVTFQGKTENLSGGGILLKGPLPDPDWVSQLLMQKIAVGVKLSLPGEKIPVVALCRAAWIEGTQKGSGKKKDVYFGLAFREISLKDRDRIFEYVIKDQMP